MLTILAFIVALLVIGAGIVWYLRNQRENTSLYQPFLNSNQTNQDVDFDPPSDFSSEYDKFSQEPAASDPAAVDSISLPSSLLQ